MNSRTIVGALFIVVAMVLGAFGGLAYARDAGVGVSPNTSPLGADVRAVSMVDLAKKMLQSASDEEKATSIGGSVLDAPLEDVKAPDGTVVATAATPDVLRTALMNVGDVKRYEMDGGTITVERTEPGTRSESVGTRAGAISAGGPYGGPNTFEGVDLSFTVTTTDPTIIFFRWDFNNDGIFDLPDQTGGGLMGKWTLLKTVPKTFNDDYMGNIVAEGWDGVSTKIIFNTGDNLGQPAVVQWQINTANSGMKFRAKATMQATQLGYFKWAFTYDSTFTLRLWDFATRVQLGTCTPTGTLLFTWHFCTLSSPVSLVTGKEYMLSSHKAVNLAPRFSGINTPPQPAKIETQGFWYRWGPVPQIVPPAQSCLQCFPDIFASNSLIPKLDFKWQESFTVPDAASSTAFLQINNVAPSVFDLQTNPSPGVEGTPVEFRARFNDPGLDDTWQVRWKFHDGTTTPFTVVSKFSGGAKVLILHSWSDQPGLYLFEANIKTALANACGNFCNRIDALDFGPLGQSRVPALSELTPYNVVLIGSNYFFNPAFANPLGDLLADYMDQGGNVVMMAFSFSPASNSGALGRWQADGYSPLPTAGNFFQSQPLATIYVPGHPILDGVSTMTALYRNSHFSVTSGAQRIADFADGRILAATKENPIVNNGARAVGLPWFPGAQTTGDAWRLVANAVRYASRAPDPVQKPMPIETDPVVKVFADDEPTTTTPVDTFAVTAEVKDDDHAPPGQVFLQDDAESGIANWVAEDLWHVTNYRFSSPASSFAFNRESDHHFGDFVGPAHSGALTTVANMNPGGASPLRLRFAAWQQTENGASEGNFFDHRGVRISANGGISWTELPWSAPNTLTKSYQTWYTYDFDITAFSGASQLKVQFFFDSLDGIFDNYEGWYVDDVKVAVPDPPRIQNGLGSNDGSVSIANSPPTIVGGFDSALRDEAEGLLFKGLEIEDKALLQGTEWFAYAYNFDDGTPVVWKYLGTMAPPKYDVLIVHSMCFSGSSCVEYTDMRKMLLGLDDVSKVDGFNFFQTPSAPSLTTLQQYDAIVVAMNWAWNPLFITTWDLVKRQLGDRLADYVDSGRGGVITFFGPFDNFFGLDWWKISGRYVTSKYAPFGAADGLSGGITLGAILDPDNDLVWRVHEAKVDTQFVHAGPMPVTVGGLGQADGRNGVRLANWRDLNPAIGIKDLNNGARTIHVGAFGALRGVDAPMLMRSAVGLASGGIPYPKVEKLTHTYGDNGVYTVDIMAIDDDMGYVWDTAANQPMEALPSPSMSHRLIPVTVDNVDPTISAGIQAFLTANVCLRVSGSSWGAVSLKMYTDGVQSSGATVTRTPGSPNDQAKCSVMRIDVLARHTFRGTVDFTPLAGKTSGSNKFWVIIDPWRKVNPGHGETVFSGTFKVQNPAGWAKSIDLPSLKRNLFDQGRGATVEFSATAVDPGTDDLAFVWMWDDGKVATVNIHQNKDGSVTASAIGDPQRLGYTEPFFDRTANTVRSPLGPMNSVVRDTATHVVKIDRDRDGDDDCDEDDDDDGDLNCGDGHHDGRYEDDDDGDGDWRHGSDDDCDDHDDDGVGIGPTHEDDDDDCDNNGGRLIFVWVGLVVLDDDNSRGYTSTFYHDGTDMEFIVLDLN